MISSDIAKRYARAFFKTAGEEGRYEACDRELSRFSTLLQEQRQLSEFLANPVFDQADKRAVVDTLLQKTGVSPLTANFIKLLVDKHRIGILSEIGAAYRTLMDDALRKARVTVKTAFPLTEELTESLRKGLARMTGREVEMAVQEDPSLIGGIAVRIGDTLYDGSIRTQLDKIRTLLGEES